MGGSKEDNRPVQRHHWEHKWACQSRGRNGMSINTAKCRATCSFGAELIVRDREFIDA